MTRIDLHFHTEQPHHIDVETGVWADEHNPADQCIVIVHDGLHDHRTPVLTPAEARYLAMELIVVAEQLEGGR